MDRAEQEHTERIGSGTVSGSRLLRKGEELVVGRLDGLPPELARALAVEVHNGLDHRFVEVALGAEREVWWHLLRHTCATALLCGWWGKKWSLEEVGKLLGHSSTRTTEMYAHLLDSALVQLAAETHEAWSATLTKSASFEGVPVVTAPSRRSGADQKSPRISRARHSGFEPLAFGSGVQLRQSKSIEKTALRISKCDAGVPQVARA